MVRSLTLLCSSVFAFSAHAGILSQYGAVTSSEIQAGAVQTNKLAVDAVTTTAILNGSVNTGKLAVDSVDSTKLLNDAGSLSKVTAGTMTISGGYVTVTGTTTFSNAGSSTTFMGPVLISSWVVAGNGTVGNPAYAFSSKTGHGMWSDGTDIFLSYNGVQAARFQSSSFQPGSGTAGGGVMTGANATGASHTWSSDTGSGIGNRSGVGGTVVIFSSKAPSIAFQTSGTTTPTTMAITFPSGIITPGNAVATTISSVSMQGVLAVNAIPAAAAVASLHVSSAPSASQNVILANGVVPGSPGIATTGTLAQGTVTSCATGSQVTSTGAFTTCVASDVRLKRDIQPLVYNPLLIDSLHPVTYRWKDTASRGTGRKTGFIAQDVGKEMPDAIIPAGGDLKGIDPMAVIAALVQEAKMLRRRVEALEKK